MKIRKWQKRAVIKLLGGAVIIVSMMLPQCSKATADCPYYNQNIRCHTGYSAWQEKNGSYYAQSDGFINNCVANTNSDTDYYAGSRSTPAYCTWTEYCKTYSDSGWVYWSKVHNDKMTARYCTTPCNNLAFDSK